MKNLQRTLLVDMAGPGRRDEPESSDEEMGFAAASPRACSSRLSLSLSLSLNCELFLFDLLPGDVPLIASGGVHACFQWCRSL